MIRTLNQLAALYVKTIYSAPNAWGQHCHPEFGQSVHIMIHMTKRFGDKATQNAISTALAIYPHDTKRLRKDAS